MQRIDAATIETPNAAKIDAAAVESPNTATIGAQGIISSCYNGTLNAARAAQATANIAEVTTEVADL